MYVHSLALDRCEDEAILNVARRRRMWLAPNLPDEDKREGGPGRRERGASLVVHVSALPRRQRDRANHDNDSHETFV